jgi:trehalose 6-phosphate synthase/phosphatase
MPNDKRLFIVSNRLPVCITTQNDQPQIKPASGGLVSAIQSYLKKADAPFSEIYWAGVPGCTPTVWNEAVNQLDTSRFIYVPVMIYKEQYENYYNGFSNSAIWPLFHYFPSYAEYNSTEFDDYNRVNEHFAEVLERNCRENDTVWIHDYHLLPLAGLLRKAIPGITIGFFLHIPFPSYELFRLLPKSWQENLLEGMLGADLIGFHTMEYATHFLQSVQMAVGINQERDILRYKDRLIKVDVFPISIDYDRFHNAYDLPEVVSLREHLREKTSGRKIIFSVDRLDYTKGVKNRLNAYYHFLKKNPHYHNKVVFMMVVVPSKDTIQKYAERKRMIDELVSRINGELGSFTWQPIYYQYNSLEFDEMVSLYSACDLALVTPLRDGMNLVSKEFVASRKDKKGVLLLSELAGASRELSDALLVNPNDTVTLADSIAKGLNMSEDEQSKRIEKMQKRISNYDVTVWAEDFMKGLESIKLKQQNFQEIFLDDYAKINLLDAYRSSNKRLLLLDYDGTLTPFSALPQQAVPRKDLLTLLRQLGSLKQNEVFIISGRNSAWLQEHFGDLPVHLVAEHGAKMKWDSSDWQTELQTHSEWKGQAHAIMETFERRCANTFTEEKEFSMVWHYRNADLAQGKLRASELAAELRQCLYDQHLDVVMGNKIVEVKNKGINKGTAIEKILNRYSYDFIFAVGDDKTDEDMFKSLLSIENCFTIKVGPNASYAKYNLLKPQMVISLLENMNYFSVATY